MLKKTVQSSLAALGYRLVPKDRDAMTLLKYAESLAITSVVDVGANDGRTSEHWLRTFREAHVHAVEPQETYSEQLNSVANAFPGRMSVWKVAATDNPGNLIFRIHEDHPSSSSILASTAKSHDLMPFTRKERQVAVKAARLDALFADCSVSLGQRVLLKLDVQGAELSTLRGCEGFLGLVVCVLCEVNLTNLYEGQAGLVDLIGYLDGFGLKFSGVAEQFHAKDGRAIYLDAVFLREDAKG